jgi:mono/diheme cytochrome c family protein
MQLERKAGLFIIAVMLSACNFSLVADVKPPPGYRFENQDNQESASDSLYPLVPPDPVKGKGIYLEECLPCHGRTGLGDGQNSASLPVPVTAIGDQEIMRKAIPAEWFRVITEGKLDRFMPSFRSLTDRQRWDVAAYILSLNVSEESLIQSENLFDENCAGCHGVLGDGRGTDTANLDAPDFTAQESMAIKSLSDLYRVISNGSGIEMPAYIDRLWEVERWGLANYVRYLSFSTTAVEESTQSAASLSSPDSNPPTNPSTTLPEAVETRMPGAITGTVIDASGNEFPPGLTVTLHAFDQMQEVFTDTTAMQTNGAYLFTEIEMPEGRVFMTSIDYGGVDYYSEAVVVEKSQSAIDLSLNVYETTTDPNVLDVDRLHYFFELLPGESSNAVDWIVRIVELHVISNTGIKTLIASQEGQPVVLFSLPSGAYNLELQDGNLGERYIRTPDGFGDTIPVHPGMGHYQVMFSYTVPYSSDTDLTWPVRLPIKALVILVPGNGIAVEGTGIQDGGIRDIEGVQYHMYEGSSFFPGQELRLRIIRRSFDIATPLSTGSGANLAIGLVTLLASLTFAMIWLLRSNHKGKPNIGRINEIPIRQLDEKPEAIMDAIIALDDLYQGGSLPGYAYLRRRLELKAHLKEKLGS